MLTNNRSSYLAHMALIAGGGLAAWLFADLLFCSSKDHPFGRFLLVLPAAALTAVPPLAALSLIGCLIDDFRSL